MLDGRVQECRVIEGLPYMDDAVVNALEARRYAPALLEGQPVECDYTFKVHLELPPLAEGH
jgi:hypothetical protein